MKKIVIIDDKQDYRDTLTRLLNLAIERLGAANKWEVISTAPLEDISRYGQWINEHNVTTILIDQQLDESSDSADNERVEYYGSTAVEVIRQTHKDVPIYIVSSHPISDALKSQLGLFEDIVAKRDLTNRIDEYIKRIMRSSEGFLERESEKLSKLSDLSEKIALGTATNAEKNQAKGIQEDLYIPLTTSMFSKRAEWTENYNKSISELENLQIEINNYLEQQNNQS